MGWVEIGDMERKIHQTKGPAHSYSTNEFKLTSVYGANDSAFKNTLWEDITCLKQHEMNAEWLIVRDLTRSEYQQRETDKGASIRWAPTSLYGHGKTHKDRPN